MNTMQDEMQAVIHNLEGRPWIQNKTMDGDAVCAHGAVMTCQGLVPGDVEIVRAVMCQQGLDEAWNDEPGRTKDEVLDHLRAIEVTDEALAATFGPQWREIVALVRQAAILTEDESQQLSTAYGFARTSALVAAHTATWNAIRQSVRGFACDVVRGPTDKTAQRTAQDTALALAVRDLIGQHGFDQEHYETLTGPWRKAIGPIHPDDTDILSPRAI